MGVSARFGREAATQHSRVRRLQAAAGLKNERLLSAYASVKR
jgi:hypothetical protein